MEKGEVELRKELVTPSEETITLKSHEICDVRSDEIN